MSKEVVNFIQDTINSSFITIFSKSFCPYCNKVKGIFDSLNARYVAIELDKRKDGNKIQIVLEAMTGSKTVPSVFINKKYFGGCDTIEALYKEGRLQKLIKTDL